MKIGPPFFDEPFKVFPDPAQFRARSGGVEIQEGIEGIHHLAPQRARRLAATLFAILVLKPRPVGCPTGSPETA